jgi:hypothetical protein
MSLAIHLGLFAVVALAIVVMSAFYAEAQDRSALRSLPKRLLAFSLGCALLAGVILVCEHTFARLG